MSPFIYMLMKNIPKNSSNDAFYDDCSHIRKFKFLNKIIYNHLALVEKKTLRFNPFMHNVVKWPNIL